MAHLALYGRVAVKRGFCRSCKEQAFVIDGKLQCCDAPFATNATSIKRATSPEMRRKLPKKAEQKAILEKQDYRCIYCEKAFGSVGFRKDKPLALRLHWDHDIPFAYSQDNSAGNFVAACHVCNGIKSDLIFRSLDDARTTLAMRRKDKGYDW